MSVLYLALPRSRRKAVQKLIYSARQNIILQMYLFAASGELRTLRPVHSFPWAQTIADWLIECKQRRPHLNIVVLLDTQTIEDPSLTHKRTGPLTRQRLQEAGIVVLHASLARTAFNPERRFPAAARFHEAWQTPGSDRLTYREWARKQNLWQTIHNVEDHRKNLVIDSGRAGLVFSHNIIDQACDWQENTIWLRGEAAAELWNVSAAAVEDALALPPAPQPQFTLCALKPFSLAAGRGKAARILDGGPEIQKAILDQIKHAKQNECREIRAASAYFSDPVTLSALSNVSQGARVRILIDNCHALSLPRLLQFFLRSTVNLFCIHNCRQTASLELRIFPSNPAEMMHLKAISFSGSSPCLIAGQANFTPNSFSGAWLETSVYTNSPGAVRGFNRHFDALWARAEPLQRYCEMRPLKRFLFRMHAWIFLSILRALSSIGFRY